MKTSGAALVMDLGGTGSRALLEIGNESHRSEAPCGNPNRVGAKAVEACIFDLLVGVGAAGRSIDRAAVGMAGASHPEARLLVGRAFERAGVVVGAAWFMNDAELAHGAAFPGPGIPGVLVVAGTGSIAVARDARGTFVRAGGKGPVAGDEGSGHWIGVRLLEAASASPALAAELARRLGEGVASGPASAVASVLDALVTDSPEAAVIATDAGESLADLAVEARMRSGVASPRVRCSGSVLLRSNSVRVAFRRRLEERGEGMVDHGDVEDVLAAGLDWLRSQPISGVPPRW